ncbi:MAG: bifunctional phosphoglucose/phosphomannose isomerase [bacterium]
METKLDNPTLLKAVDPSGMLGLVMDFSKQCREAVDITGKFEISTDYSKVNKIMITGMGGSAIGGDLLRVYARDQVNIPIFVNRDYDMPGFVDEKTLLFCASCSGNTEETLSVYQKALDAKAKIIGITSGGKLKKLCDKSSIPCVIIPGGFPPRSSLGYMFFPMVVLLDKLGILAPQKEAIEETVSLLKQLSQEMSADIETDKNHAKQLALWLYKKMPVIYSSSEKTGIVGLRWRNQFNENSKVFATSNVFPELNHNEIVGLEALGDFTRNFNVMILEDKDDNARITKRIDVSTGLMKDKVGAIERIRSRGNSLLGRLFSLISLGDFVSTYLAVLYDIDPTPVTVIDYLKKELAKE